MYLVKFYKNFFYISEDIQLFLINFNSLLIKGKFGNVILNLYNSSFVSFKENMSIIKFLFVNKNLYSNFIKYFFKVYNFSLRLYFFRLRLKGLGYRIFKLHKLLLKFFFAKNHYYYFNLPRYIYIKIRARNFFVISYNKILLNQLYYHLMLLKKLDLYEKTNSFISKNKIIFLKKRK